jgi:hypothetical protein
MCAQDRYRQISQTCAFLQMLRIVLCAETAPQSPQSSQAKLSLLLLNCKHTCWERPTSKCSHWKIMPMDPRTMTLCAIYASMIMLVLKLGSDYD